MATIAELRLEATDTPLGPTLEKHGSLTCELERVAESERPGIWFGDVEEAALESTLEADPSVEEFDRVTANGTRVLYEIAFTDETYAVVEDLLEDRGTLLSAKAANGWWAARVRFPDREHLQRTYGRLTERGVTVDIARIYELTEESSHELGLTPEQYESLVAAVKHGYFEIPRRVSMQELATELDISHQALSERLRRAYGTLASAELDVPVELELTKSN